MNHPQPASHTNAPQKTTYIPALDGMRGLAILLVIAYHYSNSGRWFSYGWMGVDIFFVLSGYLIAENLLRKKNAPHPFPGFFKNRILRILPIYFFVLIIFYLLLNLFADTVGVSVCRYYNKYLWAFILMGQNFLFIIKGAPPQPLLQHLWSIAVEVHFYLLFSLLVFLTARKNIFLLICLLIPAVMLFRIFQFHHDTDDNFPFYFNTFCRFDSFLAGSAIYFFCARYDTKKKPNHLIIWLLLTAITICIAFIPHNYQLSNIFFGTVGYTLIAIATSLILLLIIFYKQATLTAFFSWKPLTKIGKISYGIYIIHFPLFFLIKKVVSSRHWHFQNEFPQLTLLFCVIASVILTYLLSLASYKYLESYFLKFKST